MTFFLLIFISFAAGLLACMPLAPRISPPPSGLLIGLFAPWVIISLFSANSLMDHIGSFYLSFIIGMCCYWTYFETSKKRR